MTAITKTVNLTADEALAVTTIELHIRPDARFTKKYGKKVKKAGGSYTHARSDYRRIVKLPTSELALADAIVAEFALTDATTVIMRPTGLARRGAVTDRRAAPQVTVLRAKSATDAVNDWTDNGTRTWSFEIVDEEA